MKTRDELEIIRKETSDRLDLKSSRTGMRIVVGMATCGIAAGARPVLEAFRSEIKKRNLKDVTVSMTGCIGICRMEPIAEIFGAGGKKATYVNMTADKAVRIIAEHIVNGRVCEDYTIA